MTTAASVACGIRLISGASNSSVSSVAPAVTKPETWVRAPARRFTAVCDVPPPADMPPSTAPPAVANPVASNS